LNLSLIYTPCLAAGKFIVKPISPGFIGVDLPAL